MSKVLKPTPEQVEKARQAAADKAAAAAQARTEQVAKDQKWLDDKTANMSEEDKRELFNQISGDCKGTTQKDGKIIVACPLPRKLQYCVSADKFDCPNGHVSTGVGCKLSSATSAALKTDTTAIDGSFVSAEEGGSYLSPYVPWGPINGKCKTDGEPTLTHGNSSGVTIGTGVDLGAQKDPDAYLKRLEKAGVSQATRDTLKPLLGKKKAEACEALRTAKANGPIVLPQSDVELIDADAMKSRVPTLQGQFGKLGAARSANLRAMIAKESKKSMPDVSKIAGLQTQLDGQQGFDDLDGTQQSVLFSTLYHEGGITKAHTQPFVNALLDGDDDAARTALVSKTKDLDKLIASRGKAELTYWDLNE